MLIHWFENDELLIKEPDCLLVDINVIQYLNCSKSTKNKYFYSISVKEIFL